MPTDLDLRREVAEAIGWTSIHKSGMTPPSSSGKRMWLLHTPAYETDIAAAFWLVDEIRQTHEITISAPVPPRKQWDVRGWNDTTNDERFIAHAPTAPEAICRAYLAWKQSQKQP